MTNQLIRHFIDDYHKGDRSDHLRRCLISACEQFNDSIAEEMSNESIELENSPANEIAWKKMINKLQWLVKSS